MGGFLSAPVTDKTLHQGGDEIAVYGGASMQGWRKGMEDAEAAMLTLPGYENFAFFAVYDGHGGPRVAQYCAENLHNFVTADPAFPEGNIPRALSNGYLATDYNIFNSDDASLAHDESGCTAVSLTIDRAAMRLYCANAGDSRAIICREGRAIPMSVDHKPGLESEFARITAAGSMVVGGRVNASLALSRAIGDKPFKQARELPPEDQAVTALPEVTIEDVGDETQFAVLACDGIWDVMNNQEVADFVLTQRADLVDEGDFVTPDVAETIAAALLDRCLAPEVNRRGAGCDNMTAIVIFFPPGMQVRPSDTVAVDLYVGIEKMEKELEATGVAMLALVSDGDIEPLAERSRHWLELRDRIAVRRTEVENIVADRRASASGSAGGSEAGSAHAHDMSAAAASGASASAEDVRTDASMTDDEDDGATAMVTGSTADGSGTDEAAAADEETTDPMERAALKASLRGLEAAMLTAAAGRDLESLALAAVEAAAAHHALGADRNSTSESDASSSSASA